MDRLPCDETLFFRVVKTAFNQRRKTLHNALKPGVEAQEQAVAATIHDPLVGSTLELALGYSHNVYIALPGEVTATAVTDKGKNPIVTLNSIDNQLLGQVAAKIRSLRKVEPYKGKGVRFVGEIIRRKAGKTASK